MAVSTLSGRLIFVGLMAWAAKAGAELVPTLKLAVEERYDDDRLLQTNPQASSGQMVTKLSPMIGLDVKERTLNAHSFYAADLYVHSADGTTGVDHRAVIDFKDELSHRFALDSKLEVWRVSDPTSLPRGGLARTRSPILYGSAELAGAQRLTRLTTLRVGYRFEGTKIYETDPDPVDPTIRRPRPPGFAHAPFAELWYRLSRRSEIGVEYRFQYLSFGTQSSDANSVAAMYRFRISPEVKLALKLGPTYYQKLDSDPGDPSRSGWTPRVIFDLTRDAHGSRIGFSLGHELAGASGFISGVWTEYASLYGAQKFFRDFSILGGAAFYRNGPAAHVAMDSFSGPQVVKGYWVNAGLEWQLMREVSLTGTFTRLSQLAGFGGGGGLSRNVVALRLVYTAL
ncbi:MAG TPA: hypothetical protein VEM39_00080 [Myxococcaceae bacterium]|nr:hypothetical protein [Myxococcaceae bacterium]